MRNKIILGAVLLVMLAAFSSCRMRGVTGTPYHIWSPSKHHTTRHWGKERHTNTRHMFWGNGKQHYGPRPHGQRGRFRY